jgi:hypothetical protein
VDLDGGEDVAVSLQLDQLVDNHRTKAREWHTWTEVSRSVRASPFYLIMDDGTPVYVEPGENVTVAADLEASRCEFPEKKPSWRFRHVEVRRGERWYAFGDLQRASHPRAGSAYRDGASGIGWVLRAPQDGRVLVATEAIRQRYEERIGALRGWAASLAALFTVAHLIFTVPFLAAALFADRQTATVVGEREYKTPNRGGGSSRHYELRVRTDDGFTFAREVCKTTYEDARREGSEDAPVRVPIVRYGRSPAASFLGEEALFPNLWLFLGPFVEGMLLLLAVVRYREGMPWYDRRNVVEAVQGGHWVETRPERPIPRGAE